VRAAHFQGNHGRVAEWDRGVLRVDRLVRLTDFASFEGLLAEPGPWIGGFDFPFGLPAELVRDLDWPREWRALVAHCEAMTRTDFRSVLDAYRATRPLGRKYAHRKTDGPAGSSSPMKLVNPPVALMFHEGARPTRCGASPCARAWTGRPQAHRAGGLSRTACPLDHARLVQERHACKAERRADCRAQQDSRRAA
jgi:hypothetical protein